MTPSTDTVVDTLAKKTPLTFTRGIYGAWIAKGYLTIS